MYKQLSAFCLTLAVSSASYAINIDRDWSQDDDDTYTPPTSGETCNNSNNSLRPGKNTKTISVNGQRRQYILQVPRSYDGSSKVPLIMDLHPLMTGATYQSNNSGTTKLSENEGMIVAYPDGNDNAWNFGPCCTESRTLDDIGFVKAVVDEIKQEGCIDETRVYAMGYSNGGGLSHYLACEAADVFAAVAPAAFDLVEEKQCNPSRPISVFSTRGRSDFIVPFNGGRSTPPTSYRLDPIHFLGAEDTFEEWGRINQCSGRPTSIGNSCQEYTGCADNVRVVFCPKSGGHKGWEADDAWDFLKGETL